MRRSLVLLAFLGACDDERQSFEAPLAQNSVHRTAGGLAFEWNGPTAAYPSPGEVQMVLDRLWWEWVNEGWLRPEPYMVHYADTIHARSFFVSLRPVDAVDGKPYVVTEWTIAVAMAGDYLDPATGIAYAGLERLKLAWDQVNGFR